MGQKGTFLVKVAPQISIISIQTRFLVFCIKIKLSVIFMKGVESKSRGAVFV